MSRGAGRRCRAAALLALAAAAGLPAGGSPAPAVTADAVLQLAEAAPQRALALLDSADAPATAAARREQALLRAWLAALQGGAGADALAALAEAAGALTPRLAEADTRLVLALQAERLGGADAAALARQALAAYDAHCAEAPPQAADCEYRQRWQARLLVGVRERGQQATASARAQIRSALELAVIARDRRREAWTEATLAMTEADNNELARAERHLARARSAAQTPGGPDPTLRLRLALAEATLAFARRDLPASDAALQQALDQARALDAPALQAGVLAHLSDHAAKSGRPQAALQAAERGLALLRREPASPTLQRVLHSNALLARVALGQVGEARQRFEALQRDWAAAAEAGFQLATLREFGDALGDAGDLAGALEMHHRERALADRLRATNQEAALAELRTRFDREAQQRRIALLERDNALKTAELANQALQQRLWAAAGAVLVAAAGLVLWGGQRLRATRRELERSRVRLREQSERDALTGLSSRRHARAQLQASAAAADGLRGALLMLDIDHFKQINDQHGHAVGDQVLVEVARRLRGLLRPQDLVARWGGEEFLVHAPGLSDDEATALAERLLQAVGGAPVALQPPAPPGAALRVTTSIGHAVFPLPPQHLPVAAEQAVNLADMALYIAKGQGRHRAVGIRRCAAADAEALRAVEADFERAWLDGQLLLHTTLGPGPPPPASAPRGAGAH